MPNPSSSVTLTYQDLRRLPDDGLRHELIDGEHYVTPVMVYRHEDDRLELREEPFRHGGTSVPVLSTPLLPGLAIPLDEIFE